MINTHWGGVVEDNSFGTDEYMELCRQLGCKTYINGNLGSGTVREMSEWVEYMTLGGRFPHGGFAEGRTGMRSPTRVDYFGVGNESWGCGGNMRPEFYGNTLPTDTRPMCSNYHPDTPHSEDCLRSGRGGLSTGRIEVLETTHRGDPSAHGFMDGLSLHYYTVSTGDWEQKGSLPLEFDEADWYRTLKATL